MKIVVIGTGFVAQAYLRCLHYLGYHPLVLSRSWLDYTNRDELRFTLSSYKPDVVINCAGYTGRTVDDCQHNPEETKQANMILPGVIASVCEGVGCAMIHISTGCFFNGDGPFDEESQPDFYPGLYQAAKIFGEQRVMICNERSWIFRIRMPFSHIPHPRNWLTKLANYELILDGINSVTWIDEFAMRSWQLWQKAPPGIYHATNSPAVKTMQVATALHEVGLRDQPEKYSPEYFNASHVKRSAAVLDSSKFEKAYGTEFTNSAVALRWCIDQMRTSGGNAQRCPGGLCKTESPSSVQIALRQMSQNIADRAQAGRAQIGSMIPPLRKDGTAS